MTDVANVGRIEHSRRVVHVADVSAANTQLVVSTPVSEHAQRLVCAAAQYSAAPTQAGVTTEVDNSLGASYDFTLDTGSANAQSTVYLPSADLIIAPGDSIRVTAPAGGVGITSTVSVYLDEYVN